MRILVTGGAGFIGSSVVRHLLHSTNHDVVSVDKYTYAASPGALDGCEETGRFVDFCGDIRNTRTMQSVFSRYQPDAVMHLAAETHVDRSICNPLDFVDTNVMGTATLLQAATDYYRGLSHEEQARFRFHHVSTDEVFGALGENDPPFTEKTPYDPRSPYSASKAASDHLVRAWRHTYGLPTFVTNTTNNYGPHQHAEKLIPMVITRALHGHDIPIYGNGQNIRDWLFVEDHAEALVMAVEQGKPGETYAIGARQTLTNIDVVRRICGILDELRPDPDGLHERLIHFVEDRPGHDSRYEIDPSHAENALGWYPKHSFEDGLRKTVQWYMEKENAR